MKLSEIWDKANKELTQCIGDMGDRDKKKACAYGAIAYYRYAEEADILSLTGAYFRVIEEPDVQIFDTKMGARDIGVLNDQEHWTFKQFADKAREFGL